MFEMDNADQQKTNDNNEVIRKKPKKEKKLKRDEFGNPIKKKKKSSRNLDSGDHEKAKKKSRVKRKQEEDFSEPPFDHDDENVARRNSNMRKQSSIGSVQPRPPAMRMEIEIPLESADSNNNIAGNFNRKRGSATVPNLAILMAGETYLDKNMEPATGHEEPNQFRTMSETLDVVKEREKSRRGSESTESLRVPPRRYSLTSNSRSRSGSTVSLQSQESDPNMRATSRPGAVAVATAAPTGKGSRPNVAPTSESYGDPVRTGAFSVASAAPVGKQSGFSITRPSHDFGESENRVNATSLLSSIPFGKEHGPSMTQSSDTHDTVSSRVGAVAVNSAAPAGKGSGLSMSRGAESYQGATARVGAMSVATAALAGKERRTFISDVGKHDDGGTGVGAVAVASAAPSGKGGAPGLSVAMGSERYDQASSRVGALSMSTGAPTGKGERSYVGAMSMPNPAPSGKGLNTSTQGERPRIGAMTILTPVPQGKESAAAVFSAPNNSQNISSVAHAAQPITSSGTMQKGRISHFPPATVPGVQAGGPSHFPSNAETYENALRNEKTRISHLPSAETYAQDQNNAPSNAMARRKVDDSSSNSAAKRRGSAHTMQSETDNSLSKSAPGDGPSYTNSAESYDGDSFRSGSVSHETNWRSQENGRESAQRSQQHSIDSLSLTEEGESSRNGDSHARVPLGVGDYIDDVQLVGEPGVVYVGAEDLKETPWFHSCWFKLFVLALILGGAGAGTAVALLGGDKNVESPSATVPSRSPVDQVRQSQIYEILKSVTAESDLKNESSPQFAAFDWIVKYDKVTPITSGGVTTDEEKHIRIRYSLASFYYSTGGDRWVVNDGWLDVLTGECEWIFISCVNYEQDIVEISTGERNNLVGSVPSELKTLEALRELNLTNNELTAITPDIGKFSKLVNLDLSGNKIVGKIPTSIFTLSSLSVLDFGTNKFSGSISSQISGLVSLGQLYLEENILTGKLTTELEQLSRLDSLDFRANQMTGNVTQILNGLTGLMVISMADNKFTGSLTPEFVLQFQEAIEFDFGNVDLQSSTIPSEIGTLSSLGR